MGNVGSYHGGNCNVVDKTVAMSSRGTSHTCSTFYTSFRRSAAKVVLQQEASGRISERDHVMLRLENWVSEIAIVYDPVEDYQTTVVMPQELTFDPRRAKIVARQSAGEEVGATMEENILKGLCSNPLSSSNSIYKFVIQLGERLDSDEFLRVVGKYPRAASLFASQQLVARSNVSNSYHMHILQHDYSQAAAVVGKAAYGDKVLETKCNRLKVASKLLQASLAVSSPSLTSALSFGATEAHKVSMSQAADSFNLNMTDEMIALLETQQAMESTLRLSTGLLIGSSLVETIQKLVTLHPIHRQALMLAVDCAEQYTVPSRQFWWTLLRVLARTNQWETLLSLAGAMRPPIGYVPIIEVMLDDNQEKLAQKLLEVVQDVDERDQILMLLAQEDTK